MGHPARNFDSLSYANELRQAGVPEDQANLQAKALLGIVEDQLLNKQDLEKVELKLSSDIERLDAKLSADIKEIKAELSSDVRGVKVDVERVEAKLSNHINEAELRLRGEIKDSELRLFVRLISAMAVIGGALKFLPNFHL